METGITMTSDQYQEIITRLKNHEEEISTLKQASQDTASLLKTKTTALQQRITTSETVTNSRLNALEHNIQQNTTTVNKLCSDMQQFLQALRSGHVIYAPTASAATEAPSPATATTPHQGESGTLLPPWIPRQPNLGPPPLKNILWHLTTTCWTILILRS
ncbi:hypothetical protein ACA910_006370 [Epithemia clementina (nom. ined.)]